MSYKTTAYHANIQCETCGRKTHHQTVGLRGFYWQCLECGAKSMPIPMTVPGVYCGPRKQPADSMTEKTMNDKGDAR